jgi:hypothetical protein
MSDRTTNLYGAIRTRILDFDPTGSDGPLRSSLRGGMHTHSAPDNVPFPFALVRLQNRRNGRLDDSSLEEEGEVEILMFGRDRQQLVTVERAMDIAEEALLNWHTDATGWFTLRELVSRNTMPPYRSPAEAEIVQVRAVWRYTWWPTYRSQYAIPAGSAPSP